MFYQSISLSGVVAAGGGPTGPAGVREKRGAGAAWSTPWAVITVDRARQVLVGGGLAPRQHRGDARVGAGENPRPLVAGPAGEPLR